MTFLAEVVRSAPPTSQAKARRLQSQPELYQAALRGTNIIPQGVKSPAKATVVAVLVGRTLTVLGTFSGLTGAAAVDNEAGAAAAVENEAGAAAAVENEAGAAAAVENEAGAAAGKEPGASAAGNDAASLAPVAHLHPGAPDENNPPLLMLDVRTNEDGRSGAFSGRISLTREQVARLRAGCFYVDIHSAAHTGGEIRDQVRLGG